MKVVVVGQRNVGKTSLTAQLANPKLYPKSEKPTMITTTTTTTTSDDIDITKWEFTKELPETNIKEKHTGRVCSYLI